MSGIFYRVKQDFWAKGCLFYLGLLALFLLFTPGNHQPSTQNLAVTLSPPTSIHWFGCDQLGRDLFSRVLEGGQVSFLIALVSVFLALAFGTAWGLFSGYRGGYFDQWFMRVVDIWYAIPSILLIILVKEIVEQGQPNRNTLALIIALSLHAWMHFARLARSTVLQMRNLPFIESAKSMGASSTRIMLRHLLPNILPIVLTAAWVRLPLAIFSETLLSFIGLGVRPPQSSWGVLAAEGWQALRFHPHLIIFPSLVLSLTILSIQYLGNFLQDPKNRIGEKVIV